MSNFGFAQMRVVKPYEASFREARSAVGAASVLAGAQESGTIAEAVADCSLVVGASAMRNRDLQQPVKTLQEAAPIIRQQLLGGKVALLFGSEKTGLSNKDLSHCHWVLRIPTRADRPSMNLGQAVAVCLYELIRAADPQPTGEVERHATSGELDRLTARLAEALRTSGYLPVQPSPSAEEKVRRLVRRFHLNSADANTFLGMLRQLQWKMKGGQSVG